MSLPATRFIPARVGNARPAPDSRSPSAVHPRACGERCSARRLNRARTGSSPRVWGTHVRQRRRPKPKRFIPARVGNASRVDAFSCGHDGSSPRVWGTPHCCRHCRRHTRFIPARVGNAYTPAGHVEWPGGSSPRVWGTQRQHRRDPRHHRFIPARVGNAPVGFTTPAVGPVHPRACGERTPPRHQSPS